MLEEIKEINKNAVQYISNLPRDRWVPYAVKSSRYGQITSNIQESQNAAWLPARDIPALYSMLSIWNTLGEKCYQRQRKTQPTGRLTNSAWKHIKSEEAESSRYKLINSTQGIAHVSTPSGAAHIVNFLERTCTCLEFQDRKLPCRHAMAVCKEQTLDPKDYTSQLYSVNTYRNIYSDDYALEPIRIEDLKPSSFCRAPLIQEKVAVHKKDICESLPSIKKGKTALYYLW